MSFAFAYLTPKQRKVWRFRYDGLNQSEISRELDVTRQTINKLFNTINTKISKALYEAAQINKIEVRKIDFDKGFLIGYSHSVGLDAFITFSDENGIQIWYKGEGDCSSCQIVDDCRKKLVSEALNIFALK